MMIAGAAALLVLLCLYSVAVVTDDLRLLLAVSVGSVVVLVIYSAMMVFTVW